MSTFSRLFCEIPRKFHQNLRDILWEMLKIPEFRINSSKISLILTEFWHNACTCICIHVSFCILYAWKASISSFEGMHIIFWIGASACPYSRVVSRSPPRALRAICFPFLSFPVAPSYLMGRMLLRWSGFSWFSLDSKNFDRTLIWKLRTFRSLADRTFQPRSLGSFVD